jgi:hypothetical protein
VFILVKGANIGLPRLVGLAAGSRQQMAAKGKTWPRRQL